MSVSSELPGLPVSLIPGVMTCVARTRIKITLAMMTWKTVATIIVATTMLPSVIAGPYFVHLLSDEASFREAFSRFPNDAVNGLSPDKLKRLGQEAEVLQTYDDSTVKVRFDDGLEHDLPVEALVSEFSPATTHAPKLTIHESGFDALIPVHEGLQIEIESEVCLVCLWLRAWHRRARESSCVTACA